MKPFSVFFLLICAASFLHSHDSSAGTKVWLIESRPNKTVAVKGDLSTGFEINDLSWAWNSSVACFPATQQKKFTGKHVLYKTNIPPHAEMTVTVVPDDKGANFSLYGYQVGAGKSVVVPDLTTCITCEADHKWDYPKVGKKQDHTRTIEFNAITESYTIYIGVTGADGLKSGGYTLKVSLNTGDAGTGEQKPLKIYGAKAQKGKIISYSGDLKDGVPVNDLSWASKSSVACFPGTQNEKFRGNHIIYVTELPAQSKMTITVIPQNVNDNMSIYAYTTAVGNKAMVPDLNSCVECEAEHKWDYPKRGKTQDHTRSVYLESMDNPYRVVIGVAGAKGVFSGKFILKIAVE
ncbi:MAG: hypothetical protein CVV44_21815 [Spirochaetae bacterium HGW-Spirochaetae-1]|jgi:hypothetical protein|nr:MAG: hypothetical protein CVV44_21815 [Spirochaetae bacterium HGW-Spirochaetae-1]